jgi:deoxycytidine triphosphate deaminase
MGFEHSHAVWGDPGFSGQWTLELSNVSPFPLEIYEGMKIIQLVLIGLDDFPAATYGRKGHYQHQTGAEPSRVTL